jgi:hypothetical protein
MEGKSQGYEEWEEWASGPKNLASQQTITSLPLS